MICYMTYKFEGNRANIQHARKELYGLQYDDPENCYICPLSTFSHLLTTCDKALRMELRLDLLSASDELIVMGETDDEMEQEIKFARLVGMDIIFL